LKIAVENREAFLDFHSESEGKYRSAINLYIIFHVMIYIDILMLVFTNV